MISMFSERILFKFNNIQLFTWYLKRIECVDIDNCILVYLCIFGCSILTVYTFNYCKCKSTSLLLMDTCGLMPWQECILNSLWCDGALRLMLKCEKLMATVMFHPKPWEINGDNMRLSAGAYAFSRLDSRFMFWARRLDARLNRSSAHSYTEDKRQ